MNRSLVGPSARGGGGLGGLLPTSWAWPVLNSVPLRRNLLWGIWREGFGLLPGTQLYHSGGRKGHCPEAVIGAKSEWPRNGWRERKTSEVKNKQVQNKQRKKESPGRPVWKSSGKPHRRGAILVLNSLSLPHGALSTSWDLTDCRKKSLRTKPSLKSPDALP